MIHILIFIVYWKQQIHVLFNMDLPNVMICVWERIIAKLVLLIASSPQVLLTTWWCRGAASSCGASLHPMPFSLPVTRPLSTPSTGAQRTWAFRETSRPTSFRLSSSHSTPSLAPWSAHLGFHYFSSGQLSETACSVCIASVANTEPWLLTIRSDEENLFYMSGTIICAQLYLDCA